MTNKPFISVFIAQLLLFLCVVVFSFSANAMDTTMNAQISFHKAISAVAVSDMNFGDISYEASHNGIIELGTNGMVQVNGASSGLTLKGGATTAGEILISGDDLSIVEISCEDSGVLAASSGGTLNLQNIELAVNSGKSFGAGTPCSGLSNPIQTIDFGATPTPTLFFGGAINVASNSINQNSTYNTFNSGGDPVTVRVVYQ